MLKMGWIISLYTVKQAAFDEQQKETGSKTVAIATSKYASCGAFLSVQCACQIPIVLHHYLQRYSLFCVLTSHLMTSSVPNLHNTKILNISGTRGDMTKRKMPFFFTFKGLSNKPFFNSSIFHFIGTLKGPLINNTRRTDRTNNTSGKYILIDVLLCSIADYFYELCRILVSP